MVQNSQSLIASISTDAKAMAEKITTLSADNKSLADESAELKDANEKLNVRMNELNAQLEKLNSPPRKRARKALAKAKDPDRDVHIGDCRTHRYRILFNCLRSAAI